MREPAIVNFAPEKHSVELREIPRSAAGEYEVLVEVQAVGGLTMEEAVRAPEFGAPLVVLGAPLTIDADAFKTASGNLEDSLRLICERVHSYGDIAVGRRR